MYSQHPETNPHFIRSSRTDGQPSPSLPPRILAPRPRHRDRHEQPPPGPSAPQPQHKDPQDQASSSRGPQPLRQEPTAGPSLIPPPRRQDPHEPTTSPWLIPPRRQDPEHKQTSPWVKLPRRQEEEEDCLAGPRVKQPRREGKKSKPIRPVIVQSPRNEGWKQTEPHDSSPSGLVPLQNEGWKHPEPHDSSPPGLVPLQPLVPMQPLNDGKRPQRQHQGRSPLHPQSPDGLQPRPHSQRPRIPPPTKTNPITWSFAFCCAIFWVIIILGGVIVLIVYLLFRPRSPRFDIATVTLNAAYLDMGYLLNSDLTLLANFTNPNKKVKVDFSYMTIDLYYRNTMIATQYVEPFSAARAQTELKNIHMVSSQVRLHSSDILQLRKEISRNGVIFKIKGTFRARSELGSFLRYSYWLYSHCDILVTGPPTGVLKASRCRTKR